MPTEAGGTSSWKVNGTSSMVAIVGFLLVQGAAVLIWGTRLDSRVGTLETIHTDMERRLSRVDESFRKLDVIDERQRQGQTSLDNATKKLDQMSSDLGQLRDETLRSRPLPSGTFDPRRRN